MRRIDVFLCCIALAPLLGCGAGEGPSGASGSTWHGDVWPVLEARCVGCHRDGGVGPFDLSDYQKAKSVAPLLAAVAAARTMPPWHASADQSYHGDPSLTEAQISALERWASAGAPLGDPSKPGAPLPKVEQTISRVDLKLTMPESYTPQAGKTDDYRCFLVDWPETEESYVTGFAVEAGNKKLVHHVAAFLLAPNALGAQSAMEALKAQDAKEPGPGYACYGGPSGAAELIVPIQQVGQWVPGQQGMDFPAGTGIRVPPGSKVVIQLHYNMDFNPPASDQTSVMFKLDEPGKVAKRGAFAPWLNAAWIGDAMKIPAGQAQVSHEHTADPRGFWKNFVGDVDVQQGFWVHGALLHMHTLGVSAETYITRADGSKVPIVTSPRYDFNWQRMYMLKEPVRFEPGDKLTVRCVWDNSEANQGAKKSGGEIKDVYWGEGTLEEMCVANLYIAEL